MEIKDKYIKMIWKKNIIDKKTIEDAKAQGSDLETWIKDELRRLVAVEVAKHVTISVVHDGDKVTFFTCLHIIDKNQMLCDIKEGGEK